MAGEQRRSRPRALVPPSRSIQFDMSTTYRSYALRLVVDAVPVRRQCSPVSCLSCAPWMGCAPLDGRSAVPADPGRPSPARSLEALACLRRRERNALSGSADLRWPRRRKRDYSGSAAAVSSMSKIRPSRCRRPRPTWCICASARSTGPNGRSARPHEGRAAGGPLYRPGHAARSSRPPALGPGPPSGAQTCPAPRSRQMRPLGHLPMGSLRRGLPPGWWHAEGVGVVWLRRSFATPTCPGYGGPGAWFPEWITPGGVGHALARGGPRIRKEYSASVSNPPSPFVAMASGVQSTAASEGNQHGRRYRLPRYNCRAPRVPVDWHVAAHHRLGRCPGRSGHDRRCGCPAGRRGPAGRTRQNPARGVRSAHLHRRRHRRGAPRRAEPAQLCPTPAVRPDDCRPHGDLLRRSRPRSQARPPARSHWLDCTWSPRRALFRCSHDTPADPKPTRSQKEQPRCRNT